VNHSEVAVLSAHELEQAAELMRSGKLVAFPTDTFFALGAVLAEAAVSALIDVKGRTPGNPVPVLLSTIDQVSAVADSFPDPAVALAKAFWPGPLTLVLPARVEVPINVTAGSGTVGVRVPDHLLARELIALVGRPVTGTSANLSGSPPCKTVNDVLSQLGGHINAVIDAPCGEHTMPSTVVAFPNNASHEIQIIRPGAISEADLRQVPGYS
jgi:L-threonylcarbamoyladenylate synthase